MKRVVGIAAAVLLSLAASSARADVILPDQMACENATTAGTPCTYPFQGEGPDVTGTCQPDTCYEHAACDAGPDGDASPPNGAPYCTAAVPCFTCVASDGGAPASGDGGYVGTLPGDVAPPAGANGGGGCAIAARDGASSLGALLVACIVPIALRRRRR